MSECSTPELLVGVTWVTCDFPVSDATSEAETSCVNALKEVLPGKDSHL